MIQPQTRPVIDTPDDIEAEAPMFQSRRKAGAVPSDVGNGGAEPKGFDPLEWQFGDFAGQVVPDESRRGFRRGVLAACCGAFLVAVIAGVLW